MTRWPEARRNDVGRFDDPNSSLYYVPWELDTVEQQRWRAGVRRGEVGQIYAAFDEACANVAPDRVRVSPLRRDGIGGTPTADGVIVLLDPDAGAPERVLAELRCHRAWMMLSDPGSGESESPLDLPNLQLQAYGDRTGVSVDMRVTDRTLVAELQRRAASELEAAAAQRRQATR